MINLTNHVCSHCKHLNRFYRTMHGHYADYVREQQRKLEASKTSRDLTMLRYYQKNIESGVEILRLIEKRQWGSDMTYRRMNRRG